MTDDTEARLAKLSASDRERLAAMLAAQRDAARHVQDSVPRPRGSQDAPLSWQQERIWYLEQLGFGETFPLVHVIRMTGNLDVAALTRATTSLVTRHEPLRTVVRVVDGAPVQVVLPPPADALRQLTGDGTPADGERLVRRAVDAMAGGDLAADSTTFRCVLVRVAVDAHVLVLGVHHIAFDGWSAGVLLNELSVTYAAFATDTEPMLPHLDYSYGDYAAWQRARPLDAADAESWRRALGGLDGPADLRQAGSTVAHGPLPLATEHTVVEAALLARLRALARGRGMTLFMLLDAALSMLISRWAGADDVVIGTPVGGRDLAGVSDLVGCFSTVVPLRVRVDPWASAVEILDRTREACSTAFDHVDVPVEGIVPTAGGRRDSGRHPLYSIMLAAAAPTAPLRLPGLEVTLEVAERTTTDTALTVGVHDRGDRLDLSLEYGAEQFDKPTISRFARHLLALLGSLADDPEQRVADLALVPPGEQKAMLAAGDLTAEAVTDPWLTLDGLFAAHALARPDDTALVDDNGPHIYAEVAGRVSVLVERLRAEGDIPPVVAIGLSHSVDYIVAVLAVLHTGAAYLALDPSLPNDRIRLMVKDSGASLAVVDDSWNDRMRALTEDLRLLRFPDAAVTAETTGTTPTLSVRRAPNAPAYLIFTSGSTGRPKAVVGTHSAMVNRLTWHWRAFPAAPGEVYCLKTSPVFVDSVAELFTGLLRGTPTAIVSRDDAADADLLAAALDRLGVTRVVLVPELLTALLDLPDARRRLRRVTMVTVSGSRLTPELVDVVTATLPGCALVNLYGSSEVAADVTWWVCRSAEQRVPIGSPISGVRCRVVDETGALVPVGVPGELLIGGVALAQGYAFRPGLTARVFVPDPWADGERLYRTGDRVRWRESGVLEFLGRFDAQVKIRGVRVEPGEVEAALQACPGVDAAAVVAQRATSGDLRLAGFVVGSADPDHVRELLRARLPAALVPGTIQRVERLPHTPTGKLDRVALASWPANRGPRAAADTARRPATADDQAIATVWGGVLGVPDPTLDDDFFSLGGHSLLITRLSAQLSAALCRDVPIRIIHENPVLGDLCRALARVEPQVAAPAPAAGLPAVPACAVTRITKTPIDVRILEGSLPPLDAAAVTYVPGHWLRDGLLPADRWQREFVDHGGLLASVQDTPVGRIGIMVAPIAADRLYDESERTATVTARAVERAHALGARAVSLTGLLPSATVYGSAVASATRVPVTTGHEVTAAAVALTVVAALELLSRPIEAETVCVLGAGSIGLASMRLLLDARHHPARVVLCDLFARRETLEAKAEVIAALCDSEISIVTTKGPPPAEVYSAGVVIGAVNVGGILDADRVRAGSVVVDDSFPRCFDVSAAVRRMTYSSDALFLEAGLVSAPTPIPELRYLPKWLVPALGDVTTRRYEHEIMGCVLSSALLASTFGRNPTIGEVRPADALATLDLFAAAGFSAARPQVDGHAIPADVFARAGRLN